MSVARVGVAGAGTMGAGIAQLACLGGYETVLYDPDPAALERGAERLRRDLERGAERGRWTEEEAERAAKRLEPAREMSGFAGCGLVIEAAPERLELKREVFAALEAAAGPDATLATNTSSLPVAEIAAEASRPERICGMHFFNPPPLMKLVEIVEAPQTSAEASASASAVAERMGRVPIRCADSPGFIVNRCNRPFALESLRILGEGVASAAQIDTVIREDGGYRMGPFELMDLIGIDVNLEVARSFFRQRPEPRWEPHPIQEQMVAAGKLGRKSGEGFYVYSDVGGGVRPPRRRSGSGGRSTQALPSPWMGERQEGPMPGPAASDPRSPVGAPASDDPRQSLTAEIREEILHRVVAQLINEASYAVEEGVAEAGDIDTAMRLGLNHPRGPFEWLDELGAARVVAVLDELRERTGSARYELAPSLTERVS